jgi:tRNA dimethylallyltransferase
MTRKLIVILGPTASGKSELAVKLAKKFNGEIISADSRQVYKGMDIGTGKVTKKEMRGIPHHLLDAASPKRRFTVVQYRKLALKAIKKIQRKGKLPILCGGTGFYIQAVVDGIVIPEVPPDWKLREKLEKKTTKELFNELRRLDPRRARTIERKNKRRLIRALEIVKKIGRVPLLRKEPLPYPVLMIGVKKSRAELTKRIKKRFLNWLKRGLIDEIKKLRKSGLSWKKIEDFGIHYRIAAQYLQNMLTYQEMIENSIIELQNYTKRQMSWFNHQIGDFTAQNFSKKNFGEFKKNRRIIWIKNQKETEKLVKAFLKK